MDYLFGYKISDSKPSAKMSAESGKSPVLSSVMSPQSNRWETGGHTRLPAKQCKVQYFSFLKASFRLPSALILLCSSEIKCPYN